MVAAATNVCDTETATCVAANFAYAYYAALTRAKNECGRSAEEGNLISEKENAWPRHITAIRVEQLDAQPTLRGVAVMVKGILTARLSPDCTRTTCGEQHRQEQEHQQQNTDIAHCSAFTHTAQLDAKDAQATQFCLISESVLCEASQCDAVCVRADGHPDVSAVRHACDEESNTQVTELKVTGHDAVVQDAGETAASDGMTQMPERVEESATKTETASASPVACSYVDCIRRSARLSDSDAKTAKATVTVRASAGEPTVSTSVESKTTSTARKKVKLAESSAAVTGSKTRHTAEATKSVSLSKPRVSPAAHKTVSASAHAAASSAKAVISSARARAKKPATTSPSATALKTSAMSAGPKTTAKAARTPRENDAITITSTTTTSAKRTSTPTRRLIVYKSAPGRSVVEKHMAELAAATTKASAEKKAVIPSAVTQTVHVAKPVMPQASSNARSRVVHKPASPNATTRTATAAPATAAAAVRLTGSIVPHRPSAYTDATRASASSAVAVGAKVPAQRAKASLPARTTKSV